MGFDLCGPVLSVFVFLVVAGVVWRTMTKEQRLTALRYLDVALTTAWDHGREDLERFHAALKGRVRWPIATAALTALNVGVFIWTVSGHSSSSTPIGWGASFGPLTSNGQWWRILTSMFVNWQFALLAVNVAAIVSVGLALERIVGSAMFVAVFAGAGLFAGLAEMSKYPTAVLAGPSAAIFGLYGALLVVGVMLWRRGSELALPIAAIERLAGVAVVFSLSNLFATRAGGAPQIVGLFVGMLLALGAARDAPVRTVPLRRAAIAVGITFAIAVVCAVPLRGILDVRPEIQRVVAVEQRTAGSYQEAAGQYKKGRMTASSLAELIDRTIVPELEAADLRINGLHGIPPEDAPRMAEAREYLRLRSESWRLRAEGLRLTEKSLRSTAKVDGDTDPAFRARAQMQYQSMLTALGNADGAERRSLEALSRIR